MNPSIPASAPTSSTARLLADVGGTHARLAWQAAPGAALSHPAVLPVQAHASLADAIAAYLAQVRLGPPAEAAIAIANPIEGDWVAMTNHHWRFSQRELAQQLGVRRLKLLNDFTALALALPDLPAADRRQVGDGVAVPGAAIGLLGAGTGLGVSGLVPLPGGGWTALQGEGGHTTLPAQGEREWAVQAGLQRLHGHASAERALSGPGLLDTHRLLCEADGVAASCATPEAVTAAALAASDPHAHEALTLFCAWLGSVAGNLALTLGAKGGVYVGGGIVPRLGGWFDRSPFRARFEAKGRFRSYLATVPTWVITSAQSPALLGAARALDLPG